MPDTEEALENHHLIIFLLWNYLFTCKPYQVIIILSESFFIKTKSSGFTVDLPNSIWLGLLGLSMPSSSSSSLPASAITFSASALVLSFSGKASSSS
jgi:hypothetical protein